MGEVLCLPEPAQLEVYFLIKQVCYKPAGLWSTVLSLTVFGVKVTLKDAFNTSKQKTTRNNVTCLLCVLSVSQRQKPKSLTSATLMLVLHTTQRELPHTELCQLPNRLTTEIHPWLLKPRPHVPCHSWITRFKDCRWRGANKRGRLAATSERLQSSGQN